MLPDSDKKITAEDHDFSYANFYLDILPAIERLSENDRVESDRLILVGASLGCPLGVLAVEKNREKFIGMIHLTPSISYFDVHCGDALDRVRRLPTFVFAEKTDPAYESSRRFFDIPRGYKTFMEQEYAGHGTDILYHDLGFPTIILGWIEQIQRLTMLHRYPDHARSPTANPKKREDP
jgi:pimeloyl-ACP methyl ester carboxylesterase